MTLSTTTDSEFYTTTDVEVNDNGNHLDMTTDDERPSDVKKASTSVVVAEKSENIQDVLARKSEKPRDDDSVLAGSSKYDESVLAGKSKDDESISVQEDDTKIVLGEKPKSDNHDLAQKSDDIRNLQASIDTGTISIGEEKENALQKNKTFVREVHIEEDVDDTSKFTNSSEHTDVELKQPHIINNITEGMQEKLKLESCSPQPEGKIKTPCGKVLFTMKIIFSYTLVLPQKVQLRILLFFNRPVEIISSFLIS